MATIVHLFDGAALLYPFVPEPVKKALTYWHRSLEWSREKGKRVVSGEYRRLYSDLPPVLDQPFRAGQPYGSIVSVPTGLVPLVVDTLSKLGAPYSFVDGRTPFPQPTRYDDAVRMLRPFQREGFNAALFSYGGIMQCPTGWGKTHIMAAIVAAFDPAHLQDRHTPLSVAVAPDTETVRQTYAAFRTLLPGRQIGCCMGGATHESDDVVVATMDSMHNIDPAEVGILLVDEVHEAATATRIPKMMAMSKAMKWGFSATPYGRFDGADLTTTSLVGPTVYSRTYAQGIADGALVPIKVFWVTAPVPDVGVDSVHSYQRHDSVVRYGLVRNKGLLKAIVSLLDRIPADMQALCITQLMEQINELHVLAPDIAYVHGTSDAKKLSASRHGRIGAISKTERQRIYEKFRSGELQKVISTGIYQQGVNFPGLEVLVNAGGGGSAIAAGQIPGRASRSIAGKDCSYIVDFWHEWDMVVGKSGRRRPGALHSADCERSEVYASPELGFEQKWVGSIDDLPFLQRTDGEHQEAEKPCEAVHSEPAQHEGTVLRGVSVRGGDTERISVDVDAVRA